MKGSTGNALTCVVRIKPGRKDSLRQRLLQYGSDIAQCTDITFACLTTVHFMRWVIIQTGSDAGDGTLVLELNHDQTPEACIDDLIRAGSKGLHAVYEHCMGYSLAAVPQTDQDRRRLREYLCGQKVPTAAFHVGAQGKSVLDIRAQASIRNRVEQFIDIRRTQGPITSPPALYAEIRKDLVSAGLATPLAPVKSSAMPVANWMALSLQFLLYFALVPGLPIALLLLRYKERRDFAAPIQSDRERTHALTAREDLVTQNQLTHYVGVKAGRFRRFVLRTVLHAVDVLARNLFTKGSLGGITTIHFARWVIVDEGQGLLFFSNYDGSWESYLGDFIDKAAVGLTAIWSNTLGFPVTNWLVLDGARAEDQFKAWTRAHQIETPLWYSAYPDLTLRNVLHNEVIARGLLSQPADLQAWLSAL
jgi:hypothetical protein